MRNMKAAKRHDRDRRSFILGAGAFAAGAATRFASAARAGETTIYRYKTLDIAEVGGIAYETYFTKFCAEAVITGIFQPLARTVGAPYDSFPLHSLFWAHGGMMGWGTGCGTLIAAGMAVSLITGAAQDGEAIINDVITYYADTELPVYEPAPGKAKAAIRNTSLAGTPLCHISVGKWMKKENVGFSTVERSERCARVSADTAMYTAQLLNEWAERKYKRRNHPFANVINNGITSQTNCSDCHGDDIPDVPGIQ